MTNKIIYFDESGNTGQDMLNADQKVFVLASVNYNIEQLNQLKSIFDNNHEVHFKNLKNKVVQIQINEVGVKGKLIQNIKKILKKKYFNYLKLEEVNNLLLEEIIKNYRNCPYMYRFNRKKGSITLIIYFRK